MRALEGEFFQESTFANQDYDQIEAVTSTKANNEWSDDESFDEDDDNEDDDDDLDDEEKDDLTSKSTKSRPRAGTARPNKKKKQYKSYDKKRVKHLRDLQRENGLTRDEDVVDSSDETNSENSLDERDFFSRDIQTVKVNQPRMKPIGTENQPPTQNAQENTTKEKDFASEANYSKSMQQGKEQQRSELSSGISSAQTEEKNKRIADKVNSMKERQKEHETSNRNSYENMKTYLYYGGICLSIAGSIFMYYYYFRNK